MPEKNDLNKSKEIVRTLIPFLSKKNIPITPQNYRIWFEYYYDKKKEIKTHLDKLLKKGAVFTRKLNQELYQKFFVRELEKEQSEKLYKEIEVADEVTTKAGELLLSTIKDILKTTENSSEFAKKLEGYAGNVEKAAKLEDVASVLSLMVRDTHEMESKTGRIQKKLEKSSIELESLHVQLGEAKEEATHDALTGIYNRRYFDTEMQKQVDRVVKNEKTCSLIMLDIDNFKKFNDEYGHLVGDKVLKTVTREMQRALRDGDMVCRYGGEEFAVICPNMKLDRTVEIADRIRKLVNEVEFTVQGKTVDVTISGGACLINKTDTVKSAINRADKALYLAKRIGKNKIKSEKEL